MCNVGWNKRYASLMCAQLGFGLSGEMADFGPGTGSVLLEMVICSLNDAILANCGHYGVGITVHCNHNRDIGIKCNNVCIVIRKTYMHLYLGMQMTQEITPTSSQEFSSSIPKYYCFVISTWLIYFYRESTVMQTPVPPSSIEKGI